MSGHMFCLGTCVNCKRFITYAPSHVPSIRVRGEKEPVCEMCFDRWNEIHRVSKGLDPIPLHPDAYASEEA